ncbi:hypothetical protein D3C73_378270 [compost metagenome]
MIRKETVSRAAPEIVRANKWAVNPELVDAAFPYFYFGYLFNKKLQEINAVTMVRAEIAPNQFAEFPLGDFKADMTLEHIHNRGCQFRLVVTAFPPSEDFVDNPPSDLNFRLSSGEDVEVKFDRSHVPDESASADEGNGARRQATRGSRQMREEINAVERARLDTCALQASTGVINFLKGDQAKAGRKELEEYCFNLYCGVRIQAAVQVINQNYVGDKGEDILVKNLFDNRVVPGFSINHGTSAEWVKSNINDGSSRSGRYEYTQEEDDIIEAYVLFLKDIAA